jgi:hypothetical protein
MAEARAVHVVLVQVEASAPSLSNAATTEAAASRRSSSGQSHESKRHPDPFCRSPSPARPMAFPRRALASLADASLSDLRIWPAADHDSEPGEPPGAVARAAGCGRPLRHVAANLSAVAVHTARRTAVHGHTADRSAAVSHTARRARAGTLPTRSPMPPISGHGAPNVMKVTASDTVSEPQKAWSCRSGLSFFDGTRPLRRPGSPGPDLHRSTVNGADRQTALFTDRTRISVLVYTPLQRSGFASAVTWVSGHHQHRQSPLPADRCEPLASTEACGERRRIATLAVCRTIGVKLRAQQARMT